MLMQDQTAIAASGDTVINGATNGCGLVIVFDAAGTRAACYHWPGLDAESATNQTKFRNLCKELDSIDVYKRQMRFWLDKGIDGFRMDSISYIAKDPSFPELDRTACPLSLIHI